MVLKDLAMAYKAMGKKDKCQRFSRVEGENFKNSFQSIERKRILLAFGGKCVKKKKVH